jgi:hypothetical protein
MKGSPAQKRGRTSTLTMVGHIEDAFIWARRNLFPNCYFCFFVMQ